jgi:hypothetical protein
MSNVLLGQVPQYAVAADYSVSTPIVSDGNFTQVAIDPVPTNYMRQPMEQQIIAPVSTDTLKRDTINADKIVSDETATQGDKDTDDGLKEGFKISAPVILLGAAAIYFFFFRKK